MTPIRTKDRLPTWNDSGTDKSRLTIWVWNARAWELCKYSDVHEYGYTHWLPFNAIPLPEEG